MRLPGRPPRLPVLFDPYNQPLYFVTFCTHDRRQILARALVHESFRQFAARGYEMKNIAVGRYVIMPDHLHLFVAGPAEFNLEQWGRMIKQALGKALRCEGVDGEIWQRGFFDHLLRRDDSYDEKWKYVRNNPVRAGLVARPEDWPYQGEMIPIHHI